jgi:hypothetical protein
MDNLKITCRPQRLHLEQVRIGPFVILDSLLYRACILEELGNYYYHLPRLSPSDNDLISIDVPLEMLGSGDDWYYACSWCNIDTVGALVYTTNYTKRFPATDSLAYFNFQKRGRAETWKGKDKNYNISIRCYVVPELTWYAVGDYEKVDYLLNKYYQFIGKKHTHGMGALDYMPNGKHWVIERVKYNWSVHDSMSRLMRGVPVGDGFDIMNTHYYGIRPPYFLESNKRLVAI